MGIANDGQSALGFFDRHQTRAAIRSLSECRKITLFVGAGASLDLGLPSWGSLVDELLKDSINAEFSLDGPVAQIAQTVVNLNFYIPTASIIDALLEKRVDPSVTTTEARMDRAREVRNDKMAKFIYSKQDLTRFPQVPTLTGKLLDLATILKVAGKDVHIVTTNYDTSFEQAGLSEPWALQFRQDGLKLKSFVRPPHASDVGEHDIPVVHIHGRLPSPSSSETDRGHIVFSESDYIKWDEQGFDEYMTLRCGDGGFLTVGASLRDSNIVARLHKATKMQKSPRFALIPSEGDYVSLNKTGIDRSFWPDISALAAVRGDFLGIEILRPDFYGQVFQFIQEIGFAASSTSNQPYVEYCDRIRNWAREWARTRDSADSVDQRSVIEARARSISKEFEELNEIDHCKVEIWGRTDPDSRRIHRWCSSQSTWHPDAWLHSEPIEPLSDRPVIRCFCERTRLLVETPFNDNRWTHYMAVPIFLPDDPWLDIPVGAVIAFFHQPDGAHVKTGELTANKKRWFGLLADFGTAALDVAPFEYDPAPSG